MDACIRTVEGREMLIHANQQTCTAGLLIYLSLVDMMAEEFHSAMVKRDRMLQAQMFLMIFAGAGIMSVLAIWA